MLRLNVGNDGRGVLEPRAILEWVRGRDGTPYEPGIGPAELEWTTLPDGRRPQLSQGDRWMLGIVYVRDDTLGFAIQGYRLVTQPRDIVTCSIRVSVPSTRSQITRQFQIWFDENAPVRYRHQRI
jgi:hypothetical protein